LLLKIVIQKKSQRGDLALFYGCFRGGFFFETGFSKRKRKIKEKRRKNLL
jgi:hypothetical protein